MLQFLLESPLPFDESAGFTAPSAFGPYRVLHQIGSGVLGPVFRTYDPRHDRLAAVKVFRLDIVPEQVARLADALRRLASGSVPDHPALVPVFDAGLEGTTAYLASEYVTAETLDVALRHLAPAPLDRALPLLSQMAAAIDAAWTAGVGHGALHPRDVFVTADDRAVRITGMGVVAALESVGGKAAGRRPYAAPERLNGERWDIRADVYTLGAIAHELLTRRRPGGTGEQDGALTGAATPEQRVQIRRVLSMALAERPADRFASAAALADALAEVIGGELPAPALRGAPVAAAIPDVFADDRTEPLASLPSEDELAAPEAAEAASADLVPASPLRVMAPSAELPEEVDFVGALRAGSTALPPASTPLEEPPLFAASAGRARPPLRAASGFPWTALAAVAAAGIAVGIVIGYQAGRSAATSRPPAVASAAAVNVPAPPEPVLPKGTDVVVGGADGQDAERGAPADVPPAKTARASARPPAPTGRLVVRSTPPGALVVVDGRPRGQTPLTVSDLPLGRHTLEVARSGFVPRRETATLTASEASRTVDLQLEAGLPMTGGAGAPEAAMGSMFVDSRPQAARVIIDGRFAGVTPLRVPELRTGTHLVRIERAGYGAFSKTVGVQAGEQARVTAALEER